jgi:hypothetical protein
MKWVDYFLFKIYKTYRRFHKWAPWLVYNGPAWQASAITAMYSLLLILSIVLILNTWNENRGFYFHFISACLVLLAWVGLTFYFETRAKIAYYRFINESARQRVLGSVCVNAVIIMIIVFFIATVTNHS